ncbi:hypothetical protein [Streptomyces violascens]|uniref:hypothetical protein n=1 Tax=Streptomyces violascens TaxID=67381 RepID=UPI00365FC086
MNRRYRLAVTGALSVTLLAGSTAAAVATTTPAARTASVSTPRPAALTAKPSAGTVKAWEAFRISGTSTGLKAGTKVTLQHKQGAKWVSLPNTTTVNNNGTYSLRAKLGIKGKNQLRVASGGVVSPTLTVTVR